MKNPIFILSFNKYALNAAYKCFLTLVTYLNGSVFLTIFLLFLCHLGSCCCKQRYSSCATMFNKAPFVVAKQRSHLTPACKGSIEYTVVGSHSYMPHTYADE